MCRIADENGHVRAFLSNLPPIKLLPRSVNDKIDCDVPIILQETNGNKSHTIMIQYILLI